MAPAYKWCVVPQCRNTSKYSPNKLFLSVPTNPKRRQMWLQLAQRDPKSIAMNSNVFMCEDHFEMENDTKNYLKYKMGFSQKILLTDAAVPSKFYCQEDRIRHLSYGEHSPAVFVKRKRTERVAECYQSQIATETHAESIKREDNRSEEEKSKEITQIIVEAPGQYPDLSDSDPPENLSISEQVKMGKQKYLHQCIRKRKRRNIEQLKKARAAQMKKRSVRKDIDTSETESVEMEEQEGPGPTKDQNLYSQTKNNMKKLRRLDAGEADSEEENNTVDEALNMEVFPEKYMYADTEQDEPKTDNLLVEIKTQKKTARRTKPVKLKRNPKRRVVIEQEIEKSVREEIVAVEKTASKNPKETKETDIEFNQMEQLYEYGKYIAEQLMCFVKKDIQSAKTEINEVLTKYRLKYKVMNTIKPNNGETGPNTNNVGTNLPKKTRIMSKLKIIVNEQSPNHGPSIHQSGLPQIVSVVPCLNELEMMSTSYSTDTTSTGFVIVPTTAAPGSHQNNQQVNSTGSLVSPESLQIASAIPANLTGTAAIPAGTSVTQSRSSVGTSLYQPGSSTSQAVNLLGLDISLTKQQSESAESGSGLARLEIVGSQTGSSQTPGGISSSQNSLETSGPPFQMPQIHCTIPSSLKIEPEELILKYEPQSDEEEGVP